MNWKIILATLLFAFLASAAFAQDEKITVKGVILNKAGEPLDMAEVLGIAQDNTVEKGVTTGADGKYTLELTKKDVITIVVRHYDYSDEKVEKFALEEGKTEYVKNIKFGDEEKDDNVSILETVTVTGGISKSKSQESTTSLETVSSKRIDNFASTDIQSTMQMVPGVTIYDGQPSIRGSSGYTYGAGSRVVTLLNGLPMLSADRGSVNFDMLPTDNVKQIEVFKGAASVMYGAGAMGGVINVITDDPGDKPRTVIRTRMGWYDRPANPAADWDGRSSAIRPSVHLFHSRRIAENFDVTAQIDLIKDSGYRSEEFSNRIRVLLMKQYRFQGKLKGLVIGLNTQASIDSSATVIAWTDYPKGALKPGSGFLSYQFLERYSWDPTIKYTSKGGTQYIYQGRIFHQANGISTGQGGIGTLYYNEFQFKKGFLRPKKNPDGDHIIELMAGATHQRNFVNAAGVFGKATGDQMAGYFQTKIQPIKQLNIIAGMRWQYETVEGDTNSAKFLPDSIEGKPVDKTPKNYRQQTMNEPIFRLGVNYNPAVGTYIRASFGQALRSPSVAERFTATQAGPLIINPATDILVEKGYSLELGFRQLFRFGREVTKKKRAIEGFVDLSGFMMKFNNMVEFYADTAALLKGNIAFKAQNVSNASIYGGELNFMIDAQVTKKFNMLFTAGVTYIEPLDENGKKDYDGDAKTAEIADSAIKALLASRGFGKGPTSIPSDRPTTLKYRNKLLLRSSLELAYGRVSFTVNYSYTSNMINVDKVFLIDLKDYDVFGLPANELIGSRLFADTKSFRSTHNKGWHLVDVILGYKTEKPKGMVSFHAFNIFNEEYMTIPGTLGEQRNFAFQWKIEF